MEPTLTPFDTTVLKTIGRITNPRTGAYRRVYPHDLVVHLPVQRSIRQMRRDLVRLSQCGYLQRPGPRRGFHLPPLTPTDQLLLQTIDRLTRHGVYRAIYPRQVAEHLPVQRSVRQVRRDMVRLSQSRHLDRLGYRNGYRLPEYYTGYLPLQNNIFLVLADAHQLLESRAASGASTPSPVSAVSSGRSRGCQADI